MMFFHKYPYTNFHELNLDMILDMIKEIHTEWDEYQVVNSIKLGGAWDITKQYESWTVVYDSGHGYISLRPVPAGIALTNTDYWAFISDYDVLYQDLLNRINAVNSVLGGRIDDTQRDLSDLSRVVTPKNIILVGDSWGTGQYATHGWCYYLTNMLLAAGADNVYTAAMNGAGFIGYGGVQYLDRLQSIAGNVSDPNKIDVVLVAGGLNDQGRTGIEAAIKNFVDYVDTTYPNAIVISVALNNYLGHTTLTTLDLSYLEDYQKCEGYKGKYLFIDRLNTAPFVTFVNNNHVDDEGGEICARALYNILLGRDEYSFGYSRFPGTVFTNNTMIGSPLNVTASVIEYKECLFVTIGSLTVGTFTPGGFLTNAEFETASDELFPYNEEDYSHVALASGSVDGGATYITFPVLYRFSSHHKLKLSILNLNRGNSTYTNLYIFSTSFVVPKVII